MVELVLFLFPWPLMRVPFPFKLKIALLQILHHANYYFGMCSSCSVFFKIPDLRKKGRNKNAILRGNLRHTFSNLSNQITITPNTLSKHIFNKVCFSSKMRKFIGCISYWLIYLAKFASGVSSPLSSFFPHQSYHSICR